MRTLTLTKEHVTRVHRVVDDSGVPPGQEIHTDADYESLVERMVAAHSTPNQRTRLFAIGSLSDRPRPNARSHVANALAFALRFHGRKRVNIADEYMAQITAARLCEHLRQSGFVIMKKPPITGSAPRPTETKG